MKNLSFRTKITMWFSGIMAFIVSVAFAVIFWVSNSVTQKNIQDSLVEIIESNVDEVEFHTYRSEENEIHGDKYIPYLDGYLEIDDDFLDVVNGVHSSLYLASGELVHGDDLLAGTEAGLSFSDGQIRKVRGNRTVYYVFDRMLHGYNIDGLWLRGIVPQAQGTQQLGWLVHLSLVVLPALLVFAVAGGYWIAGRALRPVDSITQAAEQISQGRDLNKRIGLGGGADELRQLARVLDDMIGRLDRSFKAEQQFTSDASHELRTPMSVILAECEYTLEETRTPEEYKDALRVIQRQGRKMSKLIEDMLCFARLDQDERSYPVETVDLSALVEDICGDMSLLKDQNITLDWQAEEGISMTGNAVLLARMLTNLISNAYRYGKPDGRIHVELRHGGGIVLSVADDGMGIPDEEQEKIFQRFYRVEASRSGEGTGLGLAMVQDIARYHKGTVEVSSRAGEGSVFTVTFPE